MTLTFHRYGSTATTDTLELDETKSSIIDKLSEPTRLSAILTSETAPQIALGNYTTYEGNRYYVTKEPSVRKEHSHLYTVEVDLERSLGLGRITILANPIDHRTTFDYTGTATEHLQLIVDCLNAKFGEVGLKWARGAVHCKDTIKHIKYDGATVLDALQQIRETYETDIFAVGETLSLGQTDDKTTALPLAYGKGKGLLSGLERHKHTDDTVPNRLYVTGTKRNMVSGRLTLERDVVLAVDPKSGTIERDTGGMTIKPDGRTLYRTDKAGQYIAEWSPTDKFAQSWTRFPTEATYTNEEIYPSHVSTIKSVTKVKDHFEVNSDFDYSSLLIEGEQMQVVFQTGNLAGRDFDAKHFANTNKLAIVPKEEDDTTLPNDTLCPKVGDQYIVTGIKLPDKYITEAQRNLTDEALRHLIKLQETRYSYKADIDPVYLHNNHDTIAPQLAVGRYVRLTDPQITIGDPYVRIVGKRTYLDRPYTPEIELSNEVEPRSELTRISDKLSDFDAYRKQAIDHLRNSTKQVDNLKTSAEDLRKRVGTAEEELSKKLWSEDFSKWRENELEPSLAGKASTDDVQQSARDAITEAVKRAGEMDKQIKVGGRNLILGTTSEQESLSWTDWYSYTDFKSVRGLTAGTYTLSFQLHSYEVQDREEGKLGVHMYVRLISKDNREINLFVDPFMSHSVLEGKYVCTFTIDDTGFDSLWFRFRDRSLKGRKTISYSSIKLERGTVATDWTPAPEDVAESVSKVSTSVTDLKRTLLDPEQGEIHKLADLLGKHKEDTDKNFDDLANHPPTIDKDDLWQFWDVRKQKYVTTQYPSRGEPGKDAGRYLGRAKRIHPDFNGNYLLETEDSWRTAEEGDYVYLVGDAPNRGGDKDTFYIVREHKGNTVWEVYDIKGRKVSIEWHGTSLVVDNQPPVDLRGEAGHSPDPEEVLKTTPFQHLLEEKVTNKVAPLSQELETTKKKADDAFGKASKNTYGLFTLNRNIETVKNDLTTDLTTAKTNITNLQSVALTAEQKKDLGYLTGSIRALMSGGGETLEGLMLQRFIGLSGNNKDISAYLASYPLDAVLKAGITDFGTPNEREQVAINHNGTGHFGNLYFAGNTIDFRTGRDADPYLSIGADDMVPIADFVKSARVDDTPISTSSVQLTTSSKVYQRSVDVADDGTRLTITIDELLADCYDLDYAVLTLDGSNLASWQGNSQLPADGQKSTDGRIGFIRTPREWQNLAYERVVSKGRHVVRLELIAKSGQVTFTRVKVKRRYDTGRQQSLLTRSGLRLFGSPDRYLDVDYTPTVTGMFHGVPITNPNPYIVRIKGGMQVDELDIPGVPLCGASFNESGGQIKAFGRRAKRRGQNEAQAVYDYDMDAYKVYHSIGHTNYIPMVQVSGWSSNNINWSLTPRVYEVSSNYFVVRILSNNDNPHTKAISYVAFKTE